MKNLIKTAAAVLLILALAFNIYVLVLESKEGNSFLNNLKYALLPVTGSSMEPELKSGDAVLVKQVPFHTIATGDIIVFEREGYLITHEVIGRDEESLTTKGTSNESVDYPVSASEYKAKVLFRIPLMGSMWRISASPVSFVVFALLISLLIFGSDIFGAIFTKLEKDTEDEHPETGN